MASTVVGLFDDHAQAQQAAQDVIDAGVPREAVSVVAPDRETTRVDETADQPAIGTNFAAGVGAGAVLGGLGGLLLGMGALAIPGIGPIVAAGPLLAALTGAGVGAAVGGIIGGLTERGVPEEHAAYYAEGVRRGGTLVTVDAADDAQATRAAEILEDDGAVDIEERAARWRGQGWTGYSPSAQPYTAEQAAEERARYRPVAAAADRAAMDRVATDRVATDRVVADRVVADRVVADRDTTAVRAAEGEVKVPVVEENLEVSKRPVQTGGVRIYKRVTEKPVEESVNLRQERVTVDRRPADRPATAADLDTQGRTIEVTETVEQPVVSKQARVVEEVIVGKDVDQRTETVRDTVRRTDVQVEQLDGETVAAYDTYVPDFRRHYQTTYASSGLPYDQYDPAYRYGYDLASRYRGRDWAAVEADARREWEQGHAGTWDRFKDAIRYSWDRARAAAPGNREPGIQTGIQTGGRAADGTPDTRGVMEKAADAVTGDRIDDKTGKPVR